MDILTSLQSIGFDWQLALAHTINFLIVVALLNHFLFKPLRKRLSDRKEVIEKGVEDARAAEDERYQAKEKGEKIIRAAKAQRREIITQAQEEATALIAQSRDEASSEADDILNKARRKIAADRERMTRELEGQVGDLAILTAEKIMEREVTTDDHKKLVASVIKEADKHA
ncbi:MAG: F0F1 ATP synthase subunit B [Candidatus Paceibacterota bacterium]